MILPARLRGFSLVEVLIVMIILGILLAKGVPAYQETLASMRIREAAESIQLGVRLAQGESVRRNVAMRFQLVDAASPSGCTLASGWTSDTVHVTGWVVSLRSVVDGTDKCAAQESPNPTVATDSGIMQKATIDSLGKVMVSATSVIDGALATPITPSTVCFSSVGTMVPSCSGSAQPVKINVSSVNNLGRRLQVCITAGGVKMCDPNLPYVAGDPMACNTADPRSC